MMVFLVVILGATVVEEVVRVMAGSEKKKGEERKEGRKRKKEMRERKR